MRSTKQLEQLRLVIPKAEDAYVLIPVGLASSAAYRIDILYDFGVAPPTVLVDMC